MRSKKSKRPGSGSNSRLPSKSPPHTPNKTGGRRGRPPSKSPTTVPTQKDLSARVSQENHNHSVSPDHSRTSSGDQDGYQGHPPPAFNSKPPQTLDVGMYLNPFLHSAGSSVRSIILLFQQKTLHLRVLNLLMYLRMKQSIDLGNLRNVKGRHL